MIFPEMINFPRIDFSVGAVIFSGRNEKNAFRNNQGIGNNRGNAHEKFYDERPSVIMLFS
ncbi:MAG: hypothetical protein QF430_06560 [Candidatus Marinimicrobia bacterium]|nr:hypothetical protein [Candidatus Neomarinimicrobiota bacterium]